MMTSTDPAGMVQSTEMQPVCLYLQPLQLPVTQGGAAAGRGTKDETANSACHNGCMS